MYFRLSGLNTIALTVVQLVSVTSSAGELYSVDLKEQTLQTALPAFSRVIEQTIIYAPDEVKRYRSPAVNGTYPANQLIKLILSLSPLCAEKLQTAWLVKSCNVTMPTSPSIATKTTSSPLPKDTVEIQVTGFRDSLIKARELKRLSTTSQDSIVSEDIADFPDLNLADSLQRVPGISITREAGEGRQISIRGLGPDFTRVQVNGMEAMAMTSSPMDARGAVSRTRAFDFNIFASELFSRIDVKKSYSAEMEEGAIGGNVELYTPSPMDFDGFTSAFSLRSDYNTNSKESAPRLSLMLSNNWDNVGVLLSAAYGERYTSEIGSNTTRWRQEKKIWLGASNDPLGDAVESGELWFPRGHRYSVWNNHLTRLGLASTVQFVPSASFDITLSGLYSQLTNDLNEHHLAVKDNQQVNDIEWINNHGDKEVIYARYQNASWRSETREDANSTQFSQLNLQGRWQANSDNTFRFLIGHSASFYKQPKVNKVNILAQNVDIETDFRNDRFYGTSFSPHFDTMSFEHFDIKDLYFQENYMSSQFNAVKLDFETQLTPRHSLKIGVSQKTFRNQGHDRIHADFPHNGKAPLNEGVTDLPASFTLVYRKHPDLDWVQGDLSAIQQFYDLSDYKLDEDNIIDASNFTVNERTQAAYLKFDWDTQLADRPLLLSTGARYYETKLTSAGLSKGVPTQLTRRYTGWLPSLNLVYDVTEQWLWRFSMSRNITRPSIQALSFAANVSQGSRNEGDIGLITIGNPLLDPLLSVNVDSAVEWYFNEEGFISFALFHKNIANFIVERAQTMPYSSLGLPEALLQQGDSVDDLFNVTTPENADAVTIKGCEVAFSFDLSVLPAPLNHLGITANYTWADGNTLYRNVQGSGVNQMKTFAGLSKQSYNLTLFYEGQLWSARVATAFRSDYILTVQPGNTDQDESGYHATLYVDASAHYQLNTDLKLTLEGLNLTNVREELYSDSNDRAYNTTSSGRTLLIGLSGQF